MIIVASQRGRASELALHLMNDRDNDVVEVHRVHGFIADNVKDALQESAAITKGTKCVQHLFSVSLSAPKTANATNEQYEHAVERLAEVTGLENQPYVMVFHEKEGRRHCHAVFCRINVKTMTAVNMSRYKEKLAELSKSLYLEYGWDVPQGHLDKALSNPLNFTLPEWQQAKRLKTDPRLIKQALNQCWQDADSKQSFEKALNKYGYYLAQGDRRGFVVVDYRGEVLSLTRWLGVKQKVLTQKLGDYEQLPTVEAVKTNMDKALVNRVNKFHRQISNNYQNRIESLQAQKQHMIQRHKQARTELKINHDKRQSYEASIRQERYFTGLKRLWSHVTGQYRKIEQRNDIEALKCYQRDRTETDNLILRQLDERQDVQNQLETLYSEMQEEKEQAKTAVFSKLLAPQIKTLEKHLQPQQAQGFDLDM